MNGGSGRPAGPPPGERPEPSSDPTPVNDDATSSDQPARASHPSPESPQPKRPISAPETMPETGTAEAAQPATSATHARRRFVIWGSIAAVVVLVAGLVAVVAVDNDGADDTDAEIFLEAAQSTGADPFFAATDQLVDIEPVNLPAPGGTNLGDGSKPVSTQAIGGAEPGLYGGTRDDSRCNRLQLVEFLESNPEKATAWANVQGIEPDGIRRFVDTLTPVVLLRDTRVTNHGFRNGRANPIQSVLQAGTAVLVDDGGLPRARCACGNPLLRPVAQSTVRYAGDAWDGFDPANVQVVDSGPGTDQFVLQDLEGNEPFARPTGEGDESDFDAPPAAVAAIAPALLVPELGDPALTRPVGEATATDARTVDEESSSTTSPSTLPVSPDDQDETEPTALKLEVFETQDYCEALTRYLEISESGQFDADFGYWGSAFGDLAQLSTDDVSSNWSYLSDNVQQIGSEIAAAFEADEAELSAFLADVFVRFERIDEDSTERCGVSIQ